MKSTNQNVIKLEEYLQDKFDTKSIRIPILPDVAGKVIYLVNDPDVGINEVVSLLQKDPVITAHVIKVANSTAYSPATKIVNLHHAASMLGTNLLSEIALSVSLRSGIFILKGYIPIMKDIIKYTIATSLFTKELFGLAEADFDSLYLASMFYTAGMPVTLYHIDEFRKNEKIEFTDQEINLYLRKFKNKYVSLVLDKWAIDSDIKTIVNNHHNKSEVSSMHTECGLLRLSKELAKWVFDDSYDTKLILDSKELIDLNIHPDNLTSIFNNKEWIKNKAEELTKY
ncbi:HDOD domain-containing protein [Candidatus Kapabacteria bacterium]|nr:HDOD domain-containing protein [Candidatus Kapabacteria bacterium]